MLNIFTYDHQLSSNTITKLKKIKKLIRLKKPLTWAPTRRSVHASLLVAYNIFYYLFFIYILLLLLFNIKENREIRGIIYILVIFINTWHQTPIKFPLQYWCKPIDITGLMFFNIIKVLDRFSLY